MVGSEHVAKDLKLGVNELPWLTDEEVGFDCQAGGTEIRATLKSAFLHVGRTGQLQGTLYHLNCQNDRWSRQAFGPFPFSFLDMNYAGYSLS